MKRQQVLRHLREHGCEVAGEGGKHTRIINRNNGKRSVLSRQREIKDNVVRDICKQLDIPPPAGT